MTKMICNLIGLHKNKTAESANGAHNQENTWFSPGPFSCEQLGSNDKTVDGGVC